VLEYGVVIGEDIFIMKEKGWLYAVLTFSNLDLILVSRDFSCEKIKIFF